MKLSKWLATIIAVGAGWITLLAYFFPTAIPFSSLLFNWTQRLLAVAVVVGVINLLSVHVRKLTGTSSGWYYSAFTLLGMFIIVALNAVLPFLPPTVLSEEMRTLIGAGPGNAINQFALKYIQGAIGAALGGVTFFFLVLGGYRLLGRRRSWSAVVFIASALVTLVATAPWLPNIAFDGYTLRDLLRSLTLIPAIAGARGILLGLTLGVIATGLRVLLAQDRPYRE